MDIVTIFTSFIFIQSNLEVLDKINNNQKVYDELKNMIMKKIEEKDYVHFNCREKFIKVYLRYNNEYKKFYINIEIISSSEFNIGLEQIEFQHDNKSVNEITELIEYYVKQHLEKIINDSIVLVYDPVSLKTCLIMKNIVEDIRRINENRRINKKGWEIYYDYICETDCYLLRMLAGIKVGTIMNEYNISIYDMYCCLFSKSSDTCIRFYIKNGDIFYLFEYNVEEQNIYRIITLNDTNIKLNDEYDEDILNKLLVLCKLFDMNYTVKNATAEELKFTSNVIDIPKLDFRLKLGFDKIFFKHTFGEYEYHFNNDLTKKDGKLYIKEKTFSEFKIFFENIPTTVNVINDIYAVEILYRILKYHNCLF
ncbi:uncharacterized protein VNE69_04197 [Vairimorpha necatrix]|uniref:Uncharacterized protein n=1 Tax=Vairimorpha necatrix TaxID=6039 RepID=A0AAX4JBM7_9MICR